MVSPTLFNLVLQYVVRKVASADTKGTYVEDMDILVRSMLRAEEMFEQRVKWGSGSMNPKRNTWKTTTSIQNIVMGEDTEKITGGGFSE